MQFQHKYQALSYLQRRAEKLHRNPVVPKVAVRAGTVTEEVSGIRLHLQLLS